MGVHVPCFTEIFLNEIVLFNLNLDLLMIFQKSQLRKLTQLITSKTAEQNLGILVTLSDLKMLPILLRYSKIFNKCYRGSDHCERFTLNSLCCYKTMTSV